jgi:TIR domain-containing protein
METTEGDYLFRGGWLSGYLQSRSGEVRTCVERIPKTDFETIEDDSIIASILSDLRVEPLILDRDSIELLTEDATLDASDDPSRAAFVFQQGFVPLPATRYTFSIPFAGSEDLWGLSPNVYGTVFARGSVLGHGDHGHLELVFTLPKDSKEDLQQKLDAELRLIDQSRDLQRPEIEAFNANLRDAIAAAVRTRRQEFGGHAELAKRLGVRIKDQAASPTPATRRATVRPTAPILKSWDAFVSYAGEDRESVARPLADALRSQGLKVWFDKFELTLGDRLRRKLDEGLAASRFGIVILSHAFFSKHWPQVELDGLAQREVAGDKVILPLWYGIDRDGVAVYSPMLADRIAEPWSNGLDAVVAAIIAVVRPGTPAR